MSGLPSSGTSKSQTHNLVLRLRLLRLRQNLFLRLKLLRLRLLRLRQNLFFAFESFVFETKPF